jgi:hypothetical protein
MHTSRATIARLPTPPAHPQFLPRSEVPPIVQRYRAGGDYTVRGFEAAVGPATPIPTDLSVLVPIRHTGPHVRPTPLELFVAADEFARHGVKCRPRSGRYVIVPDTHKRFSTLTLRKHLYRVTMAIEPWASIGTYYVQTIMDAPCRADSMQPRPVPMSYIQSGPVSAAPRILRSPYDEVIATRTYTCPLCQDAFTSLTRLRIHLTKCTV